MHLGVTALPFLGPGFWGFPPNLLVSPTCNTSCRVRMRKGWNWKEWPTPLPNLHCLDSGKDVTMDFKEGPKFKVCYQIHINVYMSTVIKLHVHCNCCLIPADLELSCHKGWCALNRIEVIMDLPKFFAIFL